MLDIYAQTNDILAVLGSLVLQQYDYFKWIFNRQFLQINTNVLFDNKYDIVMKYDVS